MTKLKSTIHLKGIRYQSLRLQSRVWLDNKRLNFEKSLNVKAHSAAGFDWGNKSAGAAQLALAVCAEIYPQEIAKEVYHEFKACFISAIQSDGFNLVFDLADFNEANVEWLTSEVALKLR